jgi:hypothetical protein
MLMLNKMILRLERCISFAQERGMGGVRIVNLFAFVHTNRFRDDEKLLIRLMLIMIAT